MATDPKDRLAGALASLGQAFMARTREFSRSAADAEKHSPEITTHCSSRLGPADRNKEGALNKKRPAELA